MPSYWLFKSEPDAFSWDDLVSRGPKGESWDGVRNYQARNNMRAMKVGDLGFFYHSNEGKDVVGVCRVIATVHPEAKDESRKWECVDVAAVAPVPKPVTLEAIKINPKLADMVLVNNSRLSVQPVAADEWKEVCRMGGVDPRKLKE
jgi:predicted RNA-binding protein with PUA-like domain